MELSSLDSKQLALFEENRPPHSMNDAEMNNFEDAFRRDSFMPQNDNSILTSADSHGHMWDRFSSTYSAESVPAVASNEFHPNGHGYVTSEPQHTGFVSHHQPQQWSMEQHAMPTNSHGHFVQQSYAGPHYVAYGHPQPEMHYAAVSDQSAMPQWSPEVQSPLSPHQPSGVAVAGATTKKAKTGIKKDEHDGHGSPRQNVLAPDQSGGVRKKNNKIPIPIDRTLANIDRLIAEAPDENQKKELKSQKRLLRNRDAALTSREKKRQQMKNLEEDKVRHLEQLDAKDEKLLEQNRDINMLTEQLREAHETIQELQQERAAQKEEALSLRLRLRRLMDTEATPMSVSTSSSGYSDLGVRMGAMNVNHPEAETEWEDFIQSRLSDETGETFIFDHDHERGERTPIPDHPNTATFAAVRDTDEGKEGNSEPTGVKSLVQLLLLCGAFIASSPSQTQGGDLLNVPPVVRAAAPAVLDHFLAERELANANEVGQSIALCRQPLPTSTTSKANPVEILAGGIATSNRQKDLDEAFSLTPAEFASLSSAEYAMRGPAIDREGEPAPPRPSLAQRLAELNLDKPGSRAEYEVSTRSLLWEQIQPDVVRQFREMVRDRNELEARQRRHASPFLSDLNVKPEL